MGIESVAAELRALRSRIDAQLANPHRWPSKDEEVAADLDRYDRRLVKAAAMLQLAPPTVQRHDETLLSDEARARLEADLAGSGLDVRASVDDDRRS